MKILIDDGMQIEIGTGIGKYTKYLFHAMKNNKEIYDVDLVNDNLKKYNKKLRRLLYLFKINSIKYKKKIEKYEYVWFTNYAIPFNKSKKTKYIVTIHDLVAYLYPETLPKLYKIYIRLMIKNSIKKADYIFTISNSVKKEIIEKFPKSKDKIYVIWPGLFDSIKKIDNFERYDNNNIINIDNYPFFLFVSTVEKRKNVDMVIDAFIKLKTKNKKAQDYKLVIAGRPGYGFDEIKEKVDESEYKNDIIFTGYISDKDCNHLYNKAKAFVFPTIYEGFGLAQIECMACNLPIILSNIPTNIEISRKYGEFFDLKDINTLVEKMELFVLNKYDYKEKKKLANEYIKEFDWNIDVIKIYNILNKSRGESCGKR